MQSMTQTEYVTDVKRWYQLLLNIPSKLVVPYLLMKIGFK